MATATSYSGRNSTMITVSEDSLKQTAPSPSSSKETGQGLRHHLGPFLHVSGSHPTHVEFSDLQSLVSENRPSMISMWICPTEVKTAQLLIYATENFKVWIQHDRLEFLIGGGTTNESLQARFGNVSISSNALSAHFQINPVEWRHIALVIQGLTPQPPASASNSDSTETTTSDDLSDSLVFNVKVFIDQELKQELNVVMGGELRSVPLQFLGYKHTFFTVDEDIKVSDVLADPWGGFLSHVELWEDATDLTVDAVAFQHVDAVDPSMRWAAPDQGDGVHGIINAGNRHTGWSVYNDPQADPEWKHAGVPSVPQPTRAVLTAFATETLKRVLKTGVPDPLIFDHVPPMNSPRVAESIRQALSAYSVDELAAFIALGRKLALRTKTGGGFEVFFASDDVSEQVGIILIEQYRLTNLPGEYGRGEILHTASMAPGETTRITINSFRRTESEEESARSIVDSYSDEASRSFENSLQNQQSAEANHSSNFAYHAEVHGEASWGWGSAGASGGVSGSLDSSRRDFHDRMASTVRNHAETASRNRELDVSTTHRKRVETGRESTIERVIENINLSRPLTTAFYQVTQEIFSVLHLVGIRVAFFDQRNGKREEVPLDQAAGMLAKYLKDDALKTTWDELKTSVNAILENRKKEMTAVTRKREAWYRQREWEFRFIDDQSESSSSGSTPQNNSAEEPNLIVGETGKPQFNSSYRTRFEFIRSPAYGREPADLYENEVDGLIVRAERLIVRTDSMVCESFLGDGWALDEYATVLQQAESDRQAAESELRRSKAALAAEIGAMNQIDPRHRTEMLIKLDPRLAIGKTAIRPAFIPDDGLE